MGLGCLGALEDLTLGGLELRGSGLRVFFGLKPAEPLSFDWEVPVRAILGEGCSQKRKLAPRIPKPHTPNGLFGVLPPCEM